MIEGIAAVILAGDGQVEQVGEAAQQNKALLPLGGRMMVDYVIDALSACPEIDQLVLVGPAELCSLCNSETGVLYAPPGSTPLESFVAGVNALAAQDDRAFPWVLACTGDIPLLTPEAVADFIAKCRQREAEFYYPIVSQETTERRFPGVKRTYARLCEGVFTGGNLFLVKRDVIDSCLSRAEEFVCLRKNPMALARLIGLGMFWKYFTKRLTIREAERRVSNLFGVRGVAVLSDYPEIGVDVDKASDLELVRRELVPGSE
jgi:molybdopterin-guanine dinucleotide biosynthesis protein A